MKEYKEVPLELIDDPNAPARLNADDSEVIELAESIREVGLINPLRVKPAGDRFEVVAGHRRLLACRVINFSPVPCTVQDPEDDKDTETMLAENVARLNLTPIEEAVMIENLREKKNYGRRTVAKVLGKSEAWVQQRIDLLSYPPDIQKAVHERGLPCITAKRLAEVDDEEVRTKWTNEVLRRGVSAKTVVLWVNSYKISKAQAEGAENIDADELSAPIDYTPKGTCWVCNTRTPYERLKNILLCRECYVLLLKEMAQGGTHGRPHDDAAYHSVDSSNPPRAENGEDRGEDRNVVPDGQRGGK